MARRQQLHEILVAAAGEGAHVYFQPPANVQMEYPAIVYQRDFGDTKFAGNKPYAHTKRYQVTVIARTPDSEIVDRVAALPLCSYVRFMVADNLNHDIYQIYF